jgi:hypothetical protein
MLSFSGGFCEFRSERLRLWTCTESILFAQRKPSSMSSICGSSIAGSWGAWGSIQLPRTHFIQAICSWLHRLCSFARTRWLIYHETNFFEIQCAIMQKAKIPRTVKTMRIWMIKAARFERTSRLAGARRFAKITGRLAAVVMVEDMSTTSVDWVGIGSL